MISLVSVIPRLGWLAIEAGWSGAHVRSGQTDTEYSGANHPIPENPAPDVDEFGTAIDDPRITRREDLLNAMSTPQSTASRLDPVSEGERATFTFDGSSLHGRTGEPVAVALLAAGVRVFRTMPESGEPRGGFCFSGRCADCLMIVDGVSGVRACMTPLREGIVVETQHGHGRPIPGDLK
jgi:hypothetical protein